MNPQTAVVVRCAMASVPMTHVPMPATRTVHCICYEDTEVGGVDWWPTAEARTSRQASEYLAATWSDAKKVAFDLDVPASSSKQDIDALADAAYWAKSYEGHDPSCRLVGVVPPVQ